MEWHRIYVKSHLGMAPHWPSLPDTPDQPSVGLEPAIADNRSTVFPQPMFDVKDMSGKDLFFYYLVTENN
jgi:hypothetical protein